MKHSILRHHRVPRVVAVTAAAALLLSLAACAGSNTSTKPSGGAVTLKPDQLTNDTSQTLTVWTDATRRPGFEAYQKAHPDVKMNIVTVDNSQIPAKIQLANQAGSGWPDVIYPLSFSYHALLSSKTYGYFTQALNGIVPDQTLKGFGTNLDPCTFDGKIYCLRNDSAPAVLYYNTKTFSDFGYTVPKTMDEFVALGERVSREHPGYYVQINGDQGLDYVNEYYTSSGCPFADLQSEKTVKINWSDPRCTRVTTALDRLLKAGVIVTNTLNQAQQAELGSQGKVLMTISATWRADYGLGEGGWSWPKGTLGVAPMPTWGSSPADSRTGNEGGGGYIISSHSKNMKGALDIILYMSTSPDYQLTAGGLPAYEPLRAAWADAKVKTNPLYADPDEAIKVFIAAADNQDTVNKWVGYEAGNAFTDNVIPGIQKGKTIADQIPALQTATENLATVAGYTVTK